MSNKFNVNDIVIHRVRDYFELGIIKKVNSATHLILTNMEKYENLREYLISKDKLNPNEVCCLNAVEKCIMNNDLTEFKILYSYDVWFCTSDVTYTIDEDSLEAVNNQDVFSIERKKEKKE